MVKAKRKPLEELKAVTQPYQRILNVGCGGCVSVCLAGGQKEVLVLNNELNLAFKNENQPNRVDAYTVERQCNARHLRELERIVKDHDCMLSMACGAGAQLLAETFPDTPVLPAVNTESIGIDREVGIYEEKCRACGECVLGYTGGVCPVTRCAKGLFNGPCGGVQDGKCEISMDIPCAWYDIHGRLKNQNRLDNIKQLQMVMEWKNQTQRTTIQEAYAQRYASSK